MKKEISAQSLAQLVVDQNYMVADAAKAMNGGLPTVTSWGKQPRDEHQGKTSNPRNT